MKIHRRILCATKVAGLMMVLATMLATAAAKTSLPVSFVARRDFPVGLDPQTLSAVDFNLDGKLDLVTVNLTSSDVSVLLGNGDGSFQPALSYAVPANSRFVQVGDFNGDGKLDILVATTSASSVAIASVSILLGNGDGTFQAQKLTTVANSNCECFAVGDFNGDGKLDLVFPTAVPQLNNSALMLMLGNGDGTFQSPVIGNPGPFATPFGQSPAALQAVDLNGDGKLDLVGSAAGAFLIFLGNGDGTFPSPTSMLMNGGQTLVADVNGDGRADLVLSSTANISVFLGKGDGTFQPAVFTPFDDLSGPIMPAPGDFNGDGKIDLLMGKTVLLGNGDGTFAIPGLPPFGWTVEPSFSLAGDFNGDGRLDLATVINPGSPESGFASVVLGNGDGTFQFASFLNVPVGPGVWIVAGDFTGNGNSDLLESFVPRSSAFALLVGNGKGTFVVPSQGSGALLTSGVCGDGLPPLNNCPTATGDFNLDGKLDFVATSPRSVGLAADVAVFLGNGDGTFQPEIDYSGGGTSIALGDFNRDGVADIVTCCDSANNASILLGKGDGTFGFPVTVPVGSPAQVVTVADFNRDGNLDLAVVTGTSVAILQGNGDGTFGAAVDFPTPAGSVSVAVGDFNGDGKLDLATANSSSNSISVLLGNGDGTFGAATNIPVVNSPNSIVVGDFNGDGKADVAVVIPGSDVAILVGNGDGTFQSPSYFGVIGGSLAVADLNGDGSLDIAVAGTQLLFNRDTGPAATLAPSLAAFGNTGLNFSSTLTVTLTNSGTKTLTITGITLAGPQSSDFGQTNNCNNSLAPGASCGFMITFTPSALGLRTASIQVADNALSTPQVISLSGTGVAKLGLAIVPGGSSSATVSAGNTASYTLSIGGQGISGAASLSCTGTPRGATCSVPPSETVSANSASTFTVSVTTTSRTLAASNLVTWRSCQWWAITMIALLILPRVDRRPLWITRLPAFALMLLLCSCGGGGGGGPQQNPNGTLVGNYTLNLTATSGSTSQSVSLTLNVQ